MVSLKEQDPEISWGSEQDDFLVDSHTRRCEHLEMSLGLESTLYPSKLPYKGKG